jgi:tetratricopeptide (TPR) repeat protein
MKTIRRNLPILPMMGVFALVLAASPAQAAQAFAHQDAERALRRADQLVEEGEYKRACAEYERASELAGGPCPECLLGTARAYSGAGQHDAAVQVTWMAIPLLSSPSEKAQAYSQLGSILTLKGDLPAAKEAYQKAVELDGQMKSQVRSSLADALLKRARYTAESRDAASAAHQEEEVVVRGPGAP